MLVAAIITPPDLMTLILVTIPLYLLYEISIRVVGWVEKDLTEKHRSAHIPKRDDTGSCR